MAMVRFNQPRELISGILYHGTECVSVREMDQTIHIHIEPERDSVTALHFIFPRIFSEKKYLIEVNFHQVNAMLHIFGLYQLRNQQSVAIKTTINHFVPYCTSSQLWKGVLQDSAKAIFEGKIVVHPNAQKTDATLSNKNLLLSQNAEVNTKPTLEIYADDVKCSHGATVGYLDPDALFYLQSRGIRAFHARQLLVQAFANEILDHVPHSKNLASER